MEKNKFTSTLQSLQGVGLRFHLGINTGAPTYHPEGELRTRPSYGAAQIGVSYDVFGTRGKDKLTVVADAFGSLGLTYEQTHGLAEAEGGLKLLWDDEGDTNAYLRAFYKKSSVEWANGFGAEIGLWVQQNWAGIDEMRLGVQFIGLGQRSPRTNANGFNIVFGISPDW